MKGKYSALKQMESPRLSGGLPMIAPHIFRRSFKHNLSEAFLGVADFSYLRQIEMLNLEQSMAFRVRMYLL
jgi:hypothetical protein